MCTIFLVSNPSFFSDDVFLILFTACSAHQLSFDFFQKLVANKLELWKTAVFFIVAGQHYDAKRGCADSLLGSPLQELHWFTGKGRLPTVVGFIRFMTVHDGRTPKETNYCTSMYETAALSTAFKAACLLHDAFLLLLGFGHVNFFLQITVISQWLC